MMIEIGGVLATSGISLEVKFCWWNLKCEDK